MLQRRSSRILAPIRRKQSSRNIILLKTFPRNETALPWYGFSDKRRSPSPVFSSPPQMGSDYSRIISQNKRPAGMKLRNYSKKWIGVKVPFYLLPDTYKILARQIHPNKAKNTKNLNEQKRRTALFQLLKVVFHKK